MSTIILLHGAIGAADQLAPLETALQAAGPNQVYRFSFPGHGRDGLSADWGIDAFAAALAAYIRKQGLQRASVFGYSMGGYVALYLAAMQPELLGRIATLSAKYDWTPEGALRESKMLDPVTIQEKVPRFAAALAARHGEHWPELLLRTAAMMRELGERPLLTSAQLATITNEVMIGVGDQDNMVSLDETVRMYQAVPAAQLFVLPATPHPIEKVPVDSLAQLLNTFFNKP